MYVFHFDSFGWFDAVSPLRHQLAKSTVFDHFVGSAMFIFFITFAFCTRRRDSVKPPIISVMELSNFSLHRFVHLTMLEPFNPPSDRRNSSLTETQIFSLFFYINAFNSVVTKNSSASPAVYSCVHENDD